MNFNDIKINEKLMEKIKKYGFTEMTPIQNQCIPKIIDGRDVAGQSETGSGKTLAFAIPLLDKIKPKNGIQILVITPTRELCVQITQVFDNLGNYIGIRTSSVFGGVSIGPQIKNLKKSEIVVGTPGRILDHINRGTINFQMTEFLVIDEIDKMLEMGFIDDVQKIISYLPKKRQTLMFSATMPGELLHVMYKYLRKPLIVKTGEYVEQNKLNQVYYDIYQHYNKFSLLVHLIKSKNDGLSIVFCATRKQVDIIEKNLKYQGLNVCALHGGMTQDKRLKSLNKIKKKSTDILVATDVAARGLDIKNVTVIYNYDVPKTSKDYIHRIGRTARAGDKGSAITLLTKKDHDNFRNVQKNEDIKINRASMPHFSNLPFIIKR